VFVILSFSLFVCVEGVCAPAIRYWSCPRSVRPTQRRYRCVAVIPKLGNQACQIPNRGKVAAQSNYPSTVRTMFTVSARSTKSFVSATSWNAYAVFCPVRKTSNEAVLSSNSFAVLGTEFPKVIFVGEPKTPQLCGALNHKSNAMSSSLDDMQAHLFAASCAPPT